MTMESTLNHVQMVLKAGMTDGHELEKWYVKTWHIGDPIRLDLTELPVALVIPETAPRVDQYVGQDTELDNVVVHLLPLSIDGVDFFDSLTVGNQALLAHAKLVAMVDRVSILIRRDPTFGSLVVDAKVSGSTFRQPGYIGGGGALHSAEVKLEVKRRIEWWS